MSTARADQLQAALRDTRDLQASIATTMMLGGNATATHLEALDAMHRWRAAVVVHGCRHTSNPTPVLGLVARPGVIYCPRCIIPTADRHLKRHPHDCDNCGRYSHRLHEVSAMAGPVLTLLGHICPRCMNAAQRAAHTTGRGDDD